MRDLIVMGLGELGSLYANAALKHGMRVTPLTRKLAPASALSQAPSATPILVAVGEADLDVALESLPSDRRGSLILLQNELFPRQWARFTTHTPTVMAPWLLKKKGEPLLVARSTPVFGQFAPLMVELHQVLGFEAEVLPDEAALHQAIVDKYAFILTVNALGLLEDLSLGDWSTKDPVQVDALAREAALLGAKLVHEESEMESARPIDIDASVAQVRVGMRAMAAMRARGRTAKSRVERATANAARFGVPVPSLDRAALR
jgi:hypothetical protein